MRAESKFTDSAKRNLVIVEYENTKFYIMYTLTLCKLNETTNNIRMLTTHTPVQRKLLSALHGIYLGDRVYRMGNVYNRFQALF